MSLAGPLCCSSVVIAAMSRFLALIGLCALAQSAVRHGRAARDVRTALFSLRDRAQAFVSTQSLRPVTAVRPLGKGE